jgi:hypothetical protein
MLASFGSGMSYFVERRVHYEEDIAVDNNPSSSNGGVWRNYASQVRRAVEGVHHDAQDFPQTNPE